MKNIKALVVGAAGYAGGELVRLLLQHPAAEICGLVGHDNAGRRLDEVSPWLAGLLPESVAMIEDLQLDRPAD